MTVSPCICETVGFVKVDKGLRVNPQKVTAMKAQGKNTLLYVDGQTKPFKIKGEQPGEVEKTIRDGSRINIMA